MVGSSEIVGRVHLKDKTEGEEYEAYEIIPQEDFNHTCLQNDIALLHFLDNIEYNDNVQPVNLPRREENYVSGYGHMEKNKPLATTLQHTNLTVVSDKRCNKLYNHENFDGTKICALGVN